MRLDRSSVVSSPHALPDLPLSRRAFLAGSAAIGVGLLVGVRGRRAAAFDAAPEPFALGVASGDPNHQSVALWTRLVRDPLAGEPFGSGPIPVAWEVATDERMRRVVRRGVVSAQPESAHTVHLRAPGLAPDRWYWYRFRAGAEASPIGRTRTLPAPGTSPRRMRFAFVSCQHFEDGLYTAYEHLADEDLDFIVHLGDYIYEGAAGASLGVRQHIGDEIQSLDDYRLRHAQYRGDPNLQAVHARFPFFVTWDDHEVENNYANSISEDNDIPGQTPVSSEAFLERRANAYQAYFEHMPLSPRRAPNGSRLPLFRRFRFGRLAKFHILDTRQFRSNQPCGGVADLLLPQGDDFAIPCGGELDTPRPR